MALHSFSSRAHRFAEGGAMPSPAGPGVPGGAATGAPQGQPAGSDPGQQLQAAVQQYAQSKDPQLAVQIADMLVQLMGADGGGAGADPGAGGDPGADAGSAGVAPAGGPPQMNRKGGKVPPSFGDKSKAPGAKPAFAVPGKAAPAVAGKGAPAAPAKSGKPMDAFQKLKAKREAGGPAKK